MLKIYVRSGSDASAVKSAIKNLFRSIEGLEIRTFKGLRGLSLRDEAFKTAYREEPFTIILIGNEDAELIPELRTRFSIIRNIGKRRVRNARPHEIIRAIEECEAVLRNSIGWSERLCNYVIGEGKDLRFPKDPATDPYIIKDKALVVLNKELGVKLGGAILMIRRFSGEHIIYVKERPCFIVRIRNYGCGITLEKLLCRQSVTEGVNWMEFVKINNSYIRRVELESIKFIRKYAGESKLAVVPVSGGKDSSVTLSLTVKALGPERVIALYIDTGVDFKVNAEHARRISRILNVEFKVIKAPVLQYIVNRLRSLPTSSNRWCAREKVKALEHFINELRSELNGKVAVVSGIRDSESRQRFRDAYVEERDNITYLRPIKNWSSIMCQAYLATEELPENPLYSLGFYRIGCYICPSMRSWEMAVIREFRNVIDEYIGNQKLFSEFLKRKVKNQKA